MEVSTESMADSATAWGGLTSWADKARRAVAEQAQQVQGDIESGQAPEWATWAMGAADKAKQTMGSAAAKAKSSDLSAWGTDLTATLGKASAGFSEHAKAAQQKAALAAGSATAGLQRAGTNIGGMGVLATNPVKLAKFAGIFMLGLMLITLSFSFLPLLPIQPQKFALLFALGSITTLGSVAYLKGPASFAGAVMQREKLPFTVLFVVGLVGTLYATLIARSYLQTSIFCCMQVVGLLYFLASFVPGGQTVLNFFGRLGRQLTMALVSSKR